MGLLDQVLGGLLGRSGSGGLGGALGGALGGGMGGGRAGGLSPVLMSLLPVVLGMLTSRGGGSGGSLSSGVGGGGLGGLGGLAGMGGAGGLGGLLERFTQKGYGDHARSWVGTGANQSLPPEAVSDVLGEEQLSHIAAQAGVSQDEARQGLSQLLPEVVDHFTPGGQLPPDDQLLASMEEYQRQLTR